MERELFALRMEEYRTMVEDFLDAQCVAADEPYARLLDAMRYSLTAGGKRLRPILTLEFCRLCGGDVHAALPAACGVELLHTYSLIHDDLPCMDDDDLRRGKPSNHKVFGEATAVLAGDALQALAFEAVLSAPLAPERALRCGQILTHAAGHAGICGGQQLDLEWEGRSLDRGELMAIHLRRGRHGGAGGCGAALCRRARPCLPDPRRYARRDRRRGDLRQAHRLGQGGEKDHLRRSPRPCGV